MGLILPSAIPKAFSLVISLTIGQENTREMMKSTGKVAHILNTVVLHIFPQVLTSRSFHLFSCSIDGVCFAKLAELWPCSFYRKKVD